MYKIGDQIQIRYRFQLDKFVIAKVCRKLNIGDLESCDQLKTKNSKLSVICDPH